MTQDKPSATEATNGGVLAALPRTRPQRASARRVAARKASGSETVLDAELTTRKGARRSAEKPSADVSSRPRVRARVAAPKPPKRQATAPARPPEPRTPKQGYEPEEDVELGKTVSPPSGGELVESLADIFGELAGAGMSAGGRLLKDALSIFRRP